MLKNYFKIAWRNIIGHKLFTLINVFGLALGICACIVIYVISSYDLSFDTFHPNKGRIYRLVGESKTPSGLTLYFNNISYPTQSILKKEISGIETVGGFNTYWAKIAVRGINGKYREFNCATEDGYGRPKVITTNSDYFKIFKYEWLAGNASTALEQRFSVVVSANRARQYFGSIPFDQILGKVVVYNDSVRARVSGIVKDWDKNTDFPYTDFISINTINTKDDWCQWTFVKLLEGVTPANINAQLVTLLNKNAKDTSLFKPRGHLQSLADIHFNSNYTEDNFRKAHLPSIYGLIAIALFILFIAIINFVNLSTAQSIGRAKEIGVRKVLGSSKARLIFQFLTETFIQILFATGIAALASKPIIFLLHDFIPNGIVLTPFQPATLLFILILTFVTTLLAGFYPSFVLSSYLPAISLRGPVIKKSSEQSLLRKSLIVFQFVISLIFIIGVIVINSQLNFIRKKDLGYNTDAIITIKTPWRDSASKIKILVEKLRQLPAVMNLAMEAFPPIGDAGDLINLKYKGKYEVNLDVNMDEANRDFIPLYQMKLLAGRNFNGSDSLEELVLNESLSKAMGFKNPADGIGKMVFADGKIVSIVGVVADYHIQSLHHSILPVCIGNIPEDEKEIVLKLATNGKEIQAAKSMIFKVNSIWKEIYPKEAFDYSFLDESIANMYEKEQKTSSLMNLAMITMIFICCIGLFGLVKFIAERKRKEIAIRKVLGASVANIARLLSEDFVILILIALSIASPTSWYFMNRWLQNFAYRISIGWWVFTLAGIGGILIALLTVSYQSIKAALTNPAKSLRTE